jgi:hypothetical protein
MALACASGSGDLHPQAAMQVAAGKPLHFFLLPVNVTIRAAPEFESRVDDVFGAIVGYVRDGGNTVETFSKQEATTRWAASIIEVKQSEALEDNFDSAMRVFVRQLAETHSFDAVIAPSLVFRSTKIRDRTAKWDGAFRKFKVINQSDTAKTKGLAQSLNVDISGVSLHVMIFGRNGDLIFQKYGGLDLAHDVDMSNAEFTMSSTLALKQDLLRDSEHLDEGIGIAFDPYLPKQ